MWLMLIKVDPAGNCQFLYRDEAPFLDEGPLIITRASNVEFNNREGLWFIHNTDGSLLINKGFLKRSDAITAEVELLEVML